MKRTHIIAVICAAMLFCSGHAQSNTLSLVPGSFTFGGFVTIEKHPRLGASVASPLAMVSNAAGIKGLTLDFRGVVGSLSGDNALAGMGIGLGYTPKWAPGINLWAGFSTLYSPSFTPIKTFDVAVKIVL